MIYTPATRLALQIAEEAHRGQTDSAGFPYILHPILVAEQQKIEAAVVAALLHDVCEDCGITLKELLDRGVPKEAVEAVRLLTHRKGVPYLDYIRAMRSNKIAVAVKLADLDMNLEPARLEMCPKERKERLKKKEPLAVVAGAPVSLLTDWKDLLLLEKVFWHAAARRGQGRDSR